MENIQCGREGGRREGGKEGGKEILIIERKILLIIERKKDFVVPPIQAFIGSLLICDLTGDRTNNFGVSGQRSNQLSYPARARQRVALAHRRITVNKQEKEVERKCVYFKVQKSPILGR